MVVAAAAVVAGSATGVLAAPASAPVASVAMNESLTPVLRGEATAAGTGSESIRFWARTVGASGWDLLDGFSVAGSTAGTKRVVTDQLAIGEPFEYQVAHCDDTGCTSSDVQTGHVSPDLAAGARPGATRVPFTVGDRIPAQVDVGTGNLLVATTQLSLPRVAGSLDLGLAYNGLTLAPGSRFDSAISPGWRFSTGSDVRVKENSGARVTVYGPNGLTGTFFGQSGSSTAYTAPGTMKATLTARSPGGTDGWTLTQHDSGDVYWFGGDGRLTELRDRNGNTTTFTYAGGALTEIAADQGDVDARTVEVQADGSTGRITGLFQSPNYSQYRSVSYDYDSNGRLASITDVLGRTTSFGYSSAGDLSSITAPGGAETTFAYDAGHRVTTVTQPSDAAGDAVTRSSYDAGQTLVADPNTDPAQAVPAVPHTTYALTADGMLLAEKATDPTGAERSATFTPFQDVATTSNSSGTTTFGYAANGAESLTGVTSPTGAGSSYTYGNSAPAQYQPDSGTDAQGNTSTFTYDGAGNGLSAANAGGATAEVTRNADGTVATSVSPSGATMTYGYDADKQLTSITPPAGNSLGNRSYTYDGYGRIATYTSGRGITETYTYDEADRVLEVDFSDTTPSVSYTYDSAGRVATRADASGTTTYTYDPLGRLASRVHTAGGGLLTYAYDLAGNLEAETDAGGTTEHGYDDRNLLTSTQTPDGRVIGYGYDTDGKRTDTWFATDDGNTSWAAHTHTDYDATG
ncbi:YD repeat-containing protein, partial [Blastococcus colisei]